MPTATPDFLGMLGVLRDHDVEFIVVGGVCAALHGAPITTLDLDVVHRRTSENIERLEQALVALDAVYRYHPKRITPTPSHLASPGHQLLMTKVGPLDLLGTLVDDLGYDELLPDTVEVCVEIGLTVRLLTFEKLIEIKEKTGRPKDQVMLLTLRETLRERQKQEGTDPQA